MNQIHSNVGLEERGNGSGISHIGSGNKFISKLQKWKWKRVDLKVVEAEVEAASFKKLEVEAEAKALHAETEAHHWFVLST